MANIKNKLKSIFKREETRWQNNSIAKILLFTPAMILSWLFGLILIHEIGFRELTSLWLQLKLIFVVLLTAYHYYLGVLLNKFKLDQNEKTSKFYRYINEIPTLLLILLVFVVVFKPI